MKSLTYEEILARHLVDPITLVVADNLADTQEGCGYSIKFQYSNGELYRTYLPIKEAVHLLELEQPDPTGELSNRRRKRMNL